MLAEAGLHDRGVATAPLADFATVGSKADEPTWEPSGFGACDVEPQPTRPSAVKAKVGTEIARRVLTSMIIIMAGPTILAIAFMVVGDIKGRTSGAVALYQARREIALKYLELADAASRDSSPAPAGPTGGGGNSQPPDGAAAQAATPPPADATSTALMKQFATEFSDALLTAVVQGLRDDVAKASAKTSSPPSTDPAHSDDAVQSHEAE